jgi:hypothetical protein
MTKPKYKSKLFSKFGDRHEWRMDKSGLQSSEGVLDKGCALDIPPKSGGI